LIVGLRAQTGWILQAFPARKTLFHRKKPLAGEIQAM